MTYLGDVLSIETADGEILVFNVGETYITTWGNLGAPPTNYITRRGYKQDGVTEIDYYLEPRSWTFTLYNPGPIQESENARGRYWDLRAQLHEFFRPNRGGPLKFTLLTEDRRLRSIYARAVPGLVFPPIEPGRNDWAVDETIDLISHDPLLFDPTPVVLTPAGVVPSHLVFPITFPIQFGFVGLEYIFDVTYEGSWKTYPTITITGPYSRAHIDHLTLDITVQLTQPVGAGEQRVVSLDPAHRFIQDGDGNNKWSDLGPSDLIGWALHPHPTVPGGLNEITVNLFGASSGAAVEFSYTTKYFAI